MAVAYPRAFINNGSAGTIPSNSVLIYGLGNQPNYYHILPHEVGHALGLYHTFHGNNGIECIYECSDGGDFGDPNDPGDDCFKGDCVDDTPPDVCVGIDIGLTTVGAPYGGCITSTCGPYNDNPCNQRKTVYYSDDPTHPLYFPTVIGKLAKNVMSYAP
jgi:hypothetical protein